MKLRVLMVGTANCTVCKGLRPSAETYCSSQDIPFEYKLMKDLTSEELETLRSNASRVGNYAPMIMVYSEDNLVYISSGISSVGDMISFFKEGIQISFLK